MKKIKIFLASSISDLREDRLQVGDFIRQLNELYFDNGIHFSLVKCEDYDNSMSASGKQSEYDREIRESELVFFLFFKKVGDYTKHEFEIAMEAFKECSKPKIITYFKYVDTIEEVNAEVKAFMALLDGEFKHYYNTYNHIDALKLGILMQIKLMKLDASEVKIQDGAVLLNGQKVVAVENVPILRGNDTLMELTRKKKELNEKLNACRAAYLADPTPENESAFFDASAELNAVSKQLTEIEKATMEFMSNVAEKTVSGKILTYRYKEAWKYFNLGDYKAAREIFYEEESARERERTKNRGNTVRDEAEGYVNENSLLIDSIKAQGITAENAKEIEEKYADSMQWIEAYNLNDKSALYDYASFLYDQNHHTEAIRIAEKLLWYYNAPDASVEEVDVAKLYNLLGNLYSRTQRYAEAAEVYNKAIGIRTRLSKHNPDAYEPTLATSYNNLGNLYSDIQRYVEAAEAHKKALEIRKRLSKENPDAYEPALASSYNGLGNLYSITQKYSEAEEAYNKAIEIYARLSQFNPDAFEPALAMSYNNLGNLYSDTQRYSEAEDAYKKANEIYARLCGRNQGAFEPYLAMSLFNMGEFYYNQEKKEEAKPWIEKALEIYEQLEKKNPGTYRDIINKIKSVL